MQPLLPNVLVLLSPSFEVYHVYGYLTYYNLTFTLTFLHRKLRTFEPRLLYGFSTSLSFLKRVLLAQDLDSVRHGGRYGDRYCTATTHLTTKGQRTIIIRQPKALPDFITRHSPKTQPEDLEPRVGSERALNSSFGSFGPR